MANKPLLRAVDAVTVRVPDLDTALRFCQEQLGHEVLWRNDNVGQVGLRLPEGDTELVLATGIDQAPNWLVDSVDDAVARIKAAGGTVLSAPSDLPVGKVAVVADPFGNSLVLVDLSVGR